MWLVVGLFNHLLILVSDLLHLLLNLVRLLFQFGRIDVEIHQRFQCVFDN